MMFIEIQTVLPSLYLFRSQLNGDYDDYDDYNDYDQDFWKCVEEGPGMRILRCSDGVNCMVCDR